MKSVVGTHSAEGLKLFVRDKTSIQAKQEDGGVGEHASEDDQVVHVGTGHLDKSGREQKSGMDQNRIGPVRQKCFGMEESEI